MTTPPKDPSTKRRVLVTSALPYINGIKHLGNLVGSMLPADAYSRFHRSMGAEVLFLCATDEHGTPAELAARTQNLSVEDYCSQMHVVQKELGEKFGLSWNYFGRSSSYQNHALTQHFYTKLKENNLIEERTTRQVYSVTDGRFLPDRYVEGTCPHCGYDKARGDQCESCTRVLDPTDLINPRSAISGSTDVEVRESKHLFLRQSTMVDALRKWIGEKEQENWPLLVTSIARKWLDEGLQDRGITRDLSWGVPVNEEGFEGKVFYVWFDAPIEYIAAGAEWAEANGLEDTAWKRWWRRDSGAEDVFYIQFMAKDNIPFHSISFPVTQIGSTEPWVMADYLKGFNWLTYYGGKFSTSQKRGVFMDQALSILPSDYWRWFLLSNAPEGSDTSFTWPSLQTAVNKDLADVLGNFVNRTLKFCSSKWGNVVPNQGTENPEDKALWTALQEGYDRYRKSFDAVEIRKAASELRALWVLGNEYLQKTAPWTAYKTDPEAAAATIQTALKLIYVYGCLSTPFIPDLSKQLRCVFDLSCADQDPVWSDSIVDMANQVTPLMTFELPDVLVQKIENDQVAEWEARFGGEG